MTDSKHQQVLGRSSLDASIFVVVTVLMDNAHVRDNILLEAPCGNAGIY